MPLFKGRILEESRHFLIKVVKTYKLYGSRNNQVSIIFDGKEGIPDEEFNCPFQIFFSKSEDADSLILRMIEQSDNPSQIVVVTDDKQLRRKARLLGASFKSVEDFFKKVFKDRYSPVEDKFTLTFQQRERINAELRKLWLGEE